MTKTNSGARKWDIWKPSNKHPHWKPDEQTYAVETDRGHYNSELFDKIDETISMSAYTALAAENERLEKEMIMKKLVQEVDGEGLEALLGERILLICAGYFYEGKLIGVNESFVKLDDAAIVYASGDWKDKAYADIQKLHQKEWYVQRGLIESFGKSKND